MITAFSITHNSVAIGEPFVEAIKQIKPFVKQVLIVDLESTDTTRDILRDLNVDILICSNKKEAFELHNRAKFEKVIHFYPNEIYDIQLLKEIHDLLINCKVKDIAVKRIVVEQNFQRIRWYPEFVHRVFRRGTVSLKNEHTEYENKIVLPSTTNKQHLKRVIDISDIHGYLWAFQACFLDNILCENQCEDVKRLVPPHFIKDNHFNLDQLKKQKHWYSISTPLKIPKILYPHLGKLKYNPYLSITGR